MIENPGSLYSAAEIEIAARSRILTAENEAEHWKRECKRLMKDGFSHGAEDETYAFVQWKGTDICMDFWCDCGENQHIHGMFVYIVECPKCHAKWEMPWVLFPRRIDTGALAAGPTNREGLSVSTEGIVHK